MRAMNQTKGEVSSTTMRGRTMHILLTGGTGLIGRALCAHWTEQGHRLTVWSREPGKVARLCGADVRGIARLEELGEEPVDAVVNLARSEEDTSELQSRENLVCRLLLE